jgi:uncharacterized RDD family membrane protein YckC
MNRTGQFVGFGRRTLAWLLDLMLLAALWLPLLYIVNTLAAPLRAEPGAWLGFALLRNLLVIGVSLMVLAWTTARLGGTPGKQLLEVQVVEVDHGGRRLTPARAALRILLSLGSMFSLVGVLMLLFDEERRTFHDWLLHTRVIEQPDYADEPLPGSWP